MRRVPRYWVSEEGRLGGRKGGNAHASRVLMNPDPGGTAGPRVWWLGALAGGLLLRAAWGRLAVVGYLRGAARATFEAEEPIVER